MTQGKEHILEIIKKQGKLAVPGAASSFVIKKGDEVAGYLLVLPEVSEVKSGERAAHVHDMVILPKYLDDNDFYFVRFENMRDETS